jgi:hypothetical protein
MSKTAHCENLAAANITPNRERERDREAASSSATPKMETKICHILMV